MEFYTEFLLPLAAAHAPGIALGVAALFAASFLLGLLKRLLAATYRTAGHAWDAAARALAATPRPALRWVGVLLLLLAALRLFGIV